MICQYRITLIILAHLKKFPTKYGEEPVVIPRVKQKRRTKYDLFSINPKHPHYGRYKAAIARWYSNRSTEYHKRYGGCPLFKRKQGFAPIWLMGAMDEPGVHISCCPLGFLAYTCDIDRAAGQKPYPEWTLDRINNLDGYISTNGVPNVRWLSPMGQRLNQRERTSHQRSPEDGPVISTIIPPIKDLSPGRLRALITKALTHPPTVNKLTQSGVAQSLVRDLRCLLRGEELPPMVRRTKRARHLGSYRKSKGWK